MMLVRKIIALFLGLKSTIALTGEANNQQTPGPLQDLLLEKAVKLDEYKSVRKLEDYYGGGENAEDEDEDDESDDSYFNNKDNYFQSYSLKYSTCQKVQRFSVDAVQRGDYSSMITDNIVVLRLCPKRSCNSNAQYGCTEGYGEYAIDVSDYVRIMMNYKDHKQRNFCAFCKACMAYGYYTEASDGYYSIHDDTDDQYYNQANDDGNDDNADITGFDTNTCYHYSQRCSNVASACTSDDDASGEIDYMSYIDYVGCKEVVGDGGDTYYMSPHCDPYTQKISMAMFYDEYCSQSASEVVNAEDFTGIDFEDVMAATEELECTSCARSNFPPFYNANNYFCNNVYKHSGRCDSYLTGDIGASGDDDGDDDDQSNEDGETSEAHCAFIESIRLGTYDDFGQIYVSNSQKSSLKAAVSGDQKASLILLGLVCGALAIYSCYLHHEITNLLLKSLSGGLVKKRGSSRKKKKKKKKFIPKSYSTEYSTDGDDSRSWS